MSKILFRVKETIENPDRCNNIDKRNFFYVKKFGDEELIVYCKKVGKEIRVETADYLVGVEK